MIYTAVTTKGNAGQHMAYSQRGLQNLTQDRMSNIVLHGKPDKHQLAYDGYRANIEAFLFATATKAKVTTSAISYPLPLEPSFPLIPLPLPKVVFRLAKKPTPEQLTRFKAGMAEAGLEEMAVGKGDPVFLLRKPTMKHLTLVLPKLALPIAPNVEGFASVESAFWGAKLHVILSLLLATQTYPYSHGDDADMGGEGAEYHDISALKRMRISGAGTLDGARKIVRLTGRKIYNEDDRTDEEEEDNSDAEESKARLAIDHAVLTAKPSPFTCTINVVTPRSVPHLPGLLFPYFHGIISPDPAFLRQTVIAYFLRNLGSDDQSPRDAYKSFRAAISPYAHTPEGVIMTHIFKGVEIALDCQAVLQLIIDGDNYLGFVVLGAKFHVFAFGAWVRPLDPVELAQELQAIQTHEDLLEMLAVSMKGLPMLKGKTFDGVHEIRTSLGLATALGKVDWTKVVDDWEAEDDQDPRDMIADIVKRLSFPSKYKRYSPSDLSWAIRQMTVDLEQDLPPETEVHIPLSNFHLLAQKPYLVLLSFGPRCPSFRMTTGTEYKIPKEKRSKDDPYSVVDEKTKKAALDKLIVGEKLPHVALQEWEALRARGAIKFEPNERAAGNRGHCFRGDTREEIWDALIGGVACGALGAKDVGGAAAVGSGSGKGKDFGTGTIDDFF